jgi:hypothetical protein
MRGDGAILAVAVAARTEQNDGRQGDPAAHRMHHHAAGKVVELFAGQALDPGLHTKVLVPDDTFKERVNEANNNGRCNQLRPKACAFGNAAGDDGRNGGGKGQQEKELHQLIAILGGQHFGADKETGAIGHAIADHEIHHGGHREIHQDLDQRVDLIFAAYRAQFQKCEPGMHGQDHDAAEENEQGVGALFECFHVNLFV